MDGLHLQNLDVQCRCWTKMKGYWDYHWTEPGGGGNGTWRKYCWVFQDRHSRSQATTLSATVIKWPEWTGSPIRVCRELNSTRTNAPSHYTLATVADFTNTCSAIRRQYQPDQKQEPIRTVNAFSSLMAFNPSWAFRDSGTDVAIRNIRVGRYIVVAHYTVTPRTSMFWIPKVSKRGELLLAELCPTA